MVKIYPTDRFSTENGCAVALGNFDGVHIGHSNIITDTVKFAKENKLRSCVYTFENHPSSYLDGKAPDYSPFTSGNLLTDNVEKSAILSSFGVDVLYFEDFAAVRNMTPEQFCREILIERLSAKAVFCGENFRFGKDGDGTAEMLVMLLEMEGIPVFVAPYVRKNGFIVSSTLIRTLLEAGDTEGAAIYMTRSFEINGTIIHGKQLGRKLGFPTVNQVYPHEKIMLPFGVYATICEIEGEKYMGVSNVGVKPTVSQQVVTDPILCETHVIGYDKNAYGKKSRILFFKKLRDEKKFSSLEELTENVMQNIDETKKYFGENNIFAE